MAKYVATVGYQKFLMPSEESAIALLKLLGSAQAVDTHYLGGDVGEVYVADAAKVSVEIEGDIKVLPRFEYEGLRDSAIKQLARGDAA